MSYPALLLFLFLDREEEEVDIVQVRPVYLMQDCPDLPDHQGRAPCLRQRLPETSADHSVLLTEVGLIISQQYYTIVVIIFWELS